MRDSPETAAWDSPETVAHGLPPVAFGKMKLCDPLEVPTEEDAIGSGAADDAEPEDSRFSEADDLAPVACAKEVPPSDQLDPQFPAPIPRPLMVEDKHVQRSRSQDHFRCQE